MALHRLMRGRALMGPIVSMKRVVTKAANYTVTAQDTGTIFIATEADLVFTLPSTIAGAEYTFVTNSLSSGTGTSVSPPAADKIIGNGFTGADDKDAINTGATDRLGDMLTLLGDGTDGWIITAVTGTWARES